jgi:hypothetical protein
LAASASRLRLVDRLGAKFQRRIYATSSRSAAGGINVTGIRWDIPREIGRILRLAADLPGVTIWSVDGSIHNDG